jgi:hypothetical protein
MGSDRLTPGKRAAFSLLLILFALLAATALGEALCRFILGERLPLYYRSDEKNLTYSHDSELGWFPVRNSRKRLSFFPGDITVRHNSLGFRDREHGEKSGPRIAFLGDSFVWGYEVKRGERFTERLGEKLKGWEMINLGVSGYGTDQEYLLLMRHFDHYRPEIVFLLFYSNDFDDNVSNARYFGYYKPYFETSFEGGAVGLTLRGVPVPQSINYYYGKYPDLFAYSYLVRGLARLYDIFIEPPVITVQDDPTPYIILRMKEFVEGKGSVFVVGIADELSHELIPFLERFGVRHVDLDNELRFQTDGRHWTPEGHALAGEVIYEYLVNSGLVKPVGVAPKPG